MKIAFTSKGEDLESMIDPRFGRSEYLVVLDEETQATTFFDNREIADVAHGAGPQTSQKLIEMKAEVLITGNGPGGNAAGVLSKTGMKVFAGAEGMTLCDAYDAYKEDRLQAF